MSTLQIPWSVPNVVGHSIDPLTKRIDHTEGFGAFDSILKAHSLGIRTIDVGGGEHNYNSGYCHYKFGISLSIYDPFMREKVHNDQILLEAKERPFDSCTSISVLNVIDQKKERIEHIKLCHSVIKECGKVFFKVWPGDGSGIGQAKQGGFQSNLNLQAYINEISSIFGSKNVSLDEENMLIKGIKHTYY